MAIAVSGVTKRFGSTAVLDGVDLEVPDGSVTAILGGSGSGKTTLLRIIAGIETADAGTVAIGGAVVDDGHHRVPARHRGVGYVPQDGALFPHLTVAANVGFGLPRSSRHRVRPMLALADLDGLEGRYPHQLSGGQQQRVALARALAVEPKVLLLDEPFSSLDAELRSSVRQEVARVLAATGTTTILVTHDRDEALAMADQVAVLRHGRVAASGDPRRLYDAPDGPEAATWVGEANLVAADVRGGLAHCPLGQLPTVPGVPDGPSRVLVRPEQLVLDPLDASGSPVTGVVEEWQYHGHDATASVRIGASGPVVLARVPSSTVLAAGQEVRVSVRGPCRAWPDGAPASPAAGEGAIPPGSRGRAGTLPGHGPADLA